MSEIPVYTISFANRWGQQIQVRADQTILEVALDAGVLISHGCFYGDCGACASRLVEGEVAMHRVTGLTADQQRRGLILLCVAEPRSDCVIAVGLSG